MILYVLVIYVTLCILPLMSCTIASQLNVALLTLTHVFVMAKSIVLCLMPIKYIVLYCIVLYCLWFKRFPLQAWLKPSIARSVGQRLIY